MNVPSTYTANTIVPPAPQHQSLKLDSLPTGGSLFAQMLARSGAASPQPAAPLPAASPPAAAPKSPAPAPAQQASQSVKPEAAQPTRAQAQRVPAHPAEAKSAMDRRAAANQQSQRQAADKRMADQRANARSQDADTGEAQASADPSVDEAGDEQPAEETGQTREADDKSHGIEVSGLLPPPEAAPMLPSETTELARQAGSQGDPDEAVAGLGRRPAAQEPEDFSKAGDHAGSLSVDSQPEPAALAEGEELAANAPEFAKELQAVTDGLGGLEGLGNAGAASHAVYGEAASPASAPADAAPAEFTLPTPADSPEFAQSLGVHVSVMARDGVGHAQLHLNPSEMGPIAVQIVMDGSQAQVDFSATSAQTRQIIEAGLPELAAALKDAGLTLSGGGVFDQSRNSARGGDNPSRHAGGRGMTGGRAAAESPAVRSAVAMSRGGVDTYA